MTVPGEESLDPTGSGPQVVGQCERRRRVVLPGSGGEDGGRGVVLVSVLLILAVVPVFVSVTVVRSTQE